jgi:hypothetical protein
LDLWQDTVVIFTGDHHAPGLYRPHR